MKDSIVFTVQLSLRFFLFGSVFVKCKRTTWTCRDQFGFSHWAMAPYHSPTPHCTGVQQKYSNILDSFIHMASQEQESFPITSSKHTAESSTFQPRVRSWHLVLQLVAWFASFVIRCKVIMDIMHILVRCTDKETREWKIYLYVNVGAPLHT